VIVAKEGCAGSKQWELWTDRIDGGSARQQAYFPAMLGFYISVYIVVKVDKRE
jgi:hypothetical protein